MIGDYVWSFRTARFCVELRLERQYDGDDEDGETQRKLDEGEYVAFDSAVYVTCDGLVIGSNYLGNSVYADGEESQFWMAHRDRDPMNRNCSIMRAARGDNVCICY